MSNNMRILFPVLALLAMASCHSDFLVEEKKSISGDGWNYRDTVDFKFNISDTSRIYNLYLDFEHAADFPTQNVYLKVYTRFPDGKRPGQVISFDFFDAKGACYGKCSGKTCKLRTVLQENAYFNQPGDYVLTIEQYMRQDALPGISAIGFAIENTEQQKNNVKKSR